MAYRSRMRPDQIALQLYTVRELTAVDLPGTLRAVAAAGYRAVELAGLPETAPGELARLLDETGCGSPPRTRASRPACRRRCGRGAADRGRLQSRRRAVDAGSRPADRRRRASLRGRARRVRPDASPRKGIRLGYHNHAFEFAPLDGTTVWDVLLAELPPEVELELDVYWAAVGGRDPVAEIRATADRVRLLHMKDRAPGPDPHDAPAGEGTLPFPEIIEAARAAGVEWYIVEQDEPREPLDDITRSLRYLESLAEG